MNLFRKIQTKDKDLSQVQDNVVQVVNPLIRIPLLDGVLLEGIDLSSTALRVEHRLLRQPLGWIITDLNVNATVFRTNWDSRTITLTSSGTCRVSIWVF